MYEEYYFMNDNNFDFDLSREPHQVAATEKYQECLKQEYVYN